MIAVDTNIVVRLIVGDDEAQVARALALAVRESFFVPLTVLIESEWVLRSRFGYRRAEIADALLALPNLVDIRYEDGVGVQWAIGQYALGGEFADFVHLVASRSIGRFASFERRLASRAGPETPVTIEIPA